MKHGSINILNMKFLGTSVALHTANMKRYNTDTGPLFYIIVVFVVSESQAEDAVIARLSYTASIRAEADRLRALSKLTIKQVAKISLIFCIVVSFQTKE